MHYYGCPYCPPSEKAYLAESTMEEIKCRYDKEEACEEKHKCKEVLICKQCGEIFNATKVFLREQKRKIKDG
jgi:hypothetical protein